MGFFGDPLYTPAYEVAGDELAVFDTSKGVIRAPLTSIVDVDAASRRGAAGRDSLARSGATRASRLRLARCVPRSSWREERVRGRRPSAAA